jgi:hypothetical protein
MKNFIPIIAIFILISCNESTSVKKNEEYSPEIRAMADSIVKASRDKALFDTVGLWNAPVKVTKARFIEKEYSNYKDIQLSYKNVSGKRISAIRFSWHGKNAFGDNADMGGVFEGFGSGFTDDAISPGRTVTSQWAILSKDGKKIILAWPTEVAFEDGTKWKIGSK